VGDSPFHLFHGCPWPRRKGRPTPVHRSGFGRQGFSCIREGWAGIPQCQRGRYPGPVEGNGPKGRGRCGNRPQSSGSCLYVLSLPSGLSVTDALGWYRRRAAVLEVEPNYLIPLQIIPNDPGFPQQWALNNTGQTGGVEDADIDGAETWALSGALQGWLSPLLTRALITPIRTWISSSRDCRCLGRWRGRGLLCGHCDLGPCREFFEGRWGHPHRSGFLGLRFSRG
jgi:hypothetical protein